MRAQILFYAGLGLTIVLTIVITILARNQIRKEVATSEAESAQNAALAPSSTQGTAEATPTIVVVASSPDDSGQALTDHHTAAVASITADGAARQRREGVPQHPAGERQIGQSLKL